VTLVVQCVMMPKYVKKKRVNRTFFDDSAKPWW